MPTIVSFILDGWLLPQILAIPGTAVRLGHGFSLQLGAGWIHTP